MMKLLDFFEQDKELVGDIGREPLSPGALFKRQVLPLLESHGYNRDQIAKALGMENRQSLFRFCKGEMKLGVELAAKLAFLTGMSTGTWLNLQRVCDLYRVKDEEITPELEAARKAYAEEREKLLQSPIPPLGKTARVVAPGDTAIKNFSAG